MKNSVRVGLYLLLPWLMALGWQLWTLGAMETLARMQNTRRGGMLLVMPLLLIVVMMWPAVEYGRDYLMVWQMRRRQIRRKR